MSDDEEADCLNKGGYSQAGQKQFKTPAPSEYSSSCSMQGEIRHSEGSRIHVDPSVASTVPSHNQSSAVRDDGQRSSGPASVRSEAGVPGAAPSTLSSAHYSRRTNNNNINNTSNYNNSRNSFTTTFATTGRRSPTCRMPMEPVIRPAPEAPKEPSVMDIAKYAYMNMCNNYTKVLNMARDTAKKEAQVLADVEKAMGEVERCGERIRNTERAIRRLKRAIKDAQMDEPVVVAPTPQQPPHLTQQEQEAVRRATTLVDLFRQANWEPSVDCVAEYLYRQTSNVNPETDGVLAIGDGIPLLWLCITRRKKEVFQTCLERYRGTIDFNKNFDGRKGSTLYFLATSFKAGPGERDGKYIKMSEEFLKCVLERRKQHPNETLEWGQPSGKRDEVYGALGATLTISFELFFAWWNVLKENDDPYVANTELTVNLPRALTANEATKFTDNEKKKFLPRVSSTMRNDLR